MSEYPFSMTIRQYKSFADISKGESAQILNDKTIEFSQIHPGRWGYFTKLFCNRQQSIGLGAPIDLNLSELEEALNNVEIDKDDSLNTNKLFKKHFLEENNNAKRYGGPCSAVLRDYMPMLLMPENPNKFLKMALDCRKKGNFGKSDDVEVDFKDPLNDFCIGLDRIAQFLNFCVMLKQIPTKKDETVKNLDQIKKLEFDRDVLRELARQYDEERNKVEKDIGTDNLKKYKTQLKNLRSQYDNYCRAMINKDSGSYGNCISFYTWISQNNDFVEGYIRMRDNGPFIGVYNDGPNKDKVIDDKNIDQKKVKHGYHEGGGITDKNELTKLLKLDAVLQAQKAIDQFIDSKALEKTTLNWFEQRWNSLVQGTWIASKLGLFFKEKNVKLPIKSNRFIPKLDEFEDKKNEKKNPNKETI